MTPQKFCFRYDGSDEADKALEIIKKKFNKDYYVGLPDVYYYSDVDTNTLNHHCDYTLVPPAEFIRLMKGEEWRPKVGEPLEFKYKDDPTWFNGIYMGLSGIGDGYCVKYIGDHYYSTKTIRPIRKSLREELIDVIEYKSCSVAKADRIIQLIKERGVEG